MTQPHSILRLVPRTRSDSEEPPAQATAAGSEHADALDRGPIDATTFPALLELYWDHLLRYAERMLGDADSADDIAADSVVDHFQLMTYSSPSAPVVLASGVEARLIEAEAAYQANPYDSSPAGTGWLGILNSLRATAISPPLSPLTDPGCRTAREDLISGSAPSGCTGPGTGTASSTMRP